MMKLMLLLLRASRQILCLLIFIKEHTKLMDLHFQKSYLRINSQLSRLSLIFDGYNDFMSSSQPKAKLYQKKNTFQLVGKIDYHQQLHAATKDIQSVGHEDRKVLIIHTGGTIGMFKDENGKFQPRKDRFKSFLQNYPYFSDESETYFIGCDGFTITPETIFKKKIWYKYFELDKLIDSTNMNIERLNKILETIEFHYQNFDAFIILHGTDTMSFTASILSFMIDNLKKTIILTGSQVPIGQTRNDAINNLLCALTIAGHYNIPQVLLLFDNHLMRGNRTTKTSASSFNSFNSPNFYPIGKLGLKIQIKWELVRTCKIDKPTKFTKLSLDAHVGLLKLTPFGIPVQQKTKYLIIQSYGVGNIPTQGPFYEWIKANSQKNEKDRKVIVNISQTYQSVILNIYATGDMAFKLGLIPGSDMTCESAVAKLSYLASQNLTYQQVKQLMTRNLRGQLTEIQDRKTMKKDNYVVSCTTMLQKNFVNQSQRFKQILLYNVLTSLISERSSEASLQHLCQRNDVCIDYRFPDGGTLLHQYCRQRNKHGDNGTYLHFLLKSGIDLSIKDKDQSTALFYALQNRHLAQADILRQKQARVATSVKRVFRAIRNNQIQLLQLMCQYGDKFLYTNEQKRSVFAFTALIENYEIFELFRDNLDWEEEEVYAKQKDIYGKSGQDYITVKGWQLQ